MPTKTPKTPKKPTKKVMPKPPKKKTEIDKALERMLKTKPQKGKKK